MAKKQLTKEKKRYETDLWIILITIAAVFLGYVFFEDSLMQFVKNDDNSIILRLLLNAALQFGMAGLGITIVCILRKEKFSQFGLVKKNALKAIVGTVLCFTPDIICVFLSGQFEGYCPFSVMLFDDVLAAGFPINVLGIAVIAIAWGFFEGFNYAVIADKINLANPPKNMWLDMGAITCAVICILVHPMSTSFWGIVDIITTFIAIYGMLIIKRKTNNAWGCVFAFCFIWNAL